MSINEYKEVEMLSIFKALSEETRLRILSLIWDDELCVCEIESSLELTQSKASRHLTVLKSAGILCCTKKAQWAYYKISEDFKFSHLCLCEYLQQKLKELPTYQADKENFQRNKEQNLCEKIAETTEL